MNKMKTVLATTYAVNPYKGSEDGMGWNFVYQIARFNKVIAVTRQNNRKHIEAFMEENPSSVYENMSFVYFDLPYWMRFWKKKSRGAMLYFWMWQRSIPKLISKLNIVFDIAHNLNFHNDWTPSHLWKLKKPFVWGPIGHHPRIPTQYLKPYKNTYRIKDVLSWAVKKYFWKYSRSLKMTTQKADHVLCMNSSVPDMLKEVENKYTIMPSVATEDFGHEPLKTSSKFTLVSAGRLVPLKGFDLTISAFADFLSALAPDQKANCELLIIGDGPEKINYQELARKNDLEQHVKFIRWIDRTDLMDILKDASLFVFPSHEGAGMIVAEALSFGLPVICLDNYGPGEFINQDCGIGVAEQDYTGTVKALSDGILELYNNPQKRNRLSAGARTQFKNYFDWNRRGETLSTIYKNL